MLTTTLMFRHSPASSCQSSPRSTTEQLAGIAEPSDPEILQLVSMDSPREARYAYLDLPGKCAHPFNNPTLFCGNLRASWSTAFIYKLFSHPDCPRPKAIRIRAEPSQP